MSRFPRAALSVLEQPEDDRPGVLERLVEPRRAQGRGDAAGRVELGGADHAGKPAISGALAAMRTSGESGVGRLRQKVSTPSGPRAVMVTPTRLGVGGIPEGTAWVRISTARVPGGRGTPPRNELPEGVR